MKRTIFAKAAGVVAGALLLLIPLESSAHTRVGIGIGIGVPGYYYGPGPYYAPYYGPNYYYYPPPPVEYVQPPPPTVIEAPSYFWYYCPPAKGYFPYIRECPSGWQAVAAQRQAAAAGNRHPAPAPGGRVTYRLGDVLFGTGKSELKAGATATLDSLVASINKEPNRQFVIEGHTDSVGSGANNLALSQRRAEAVKQYLVGHGVDAGRITAIGKGEEGAIASNTTPEGRRQNRRVDVIVN